MEKIDRLRWADGIAFTALGVKIGVRVDDPTMLPRVRALLPPVARPSSARVVDKLFSLVVGGPGPRPGLRRFSLLYADISRVSRATEIDQVLEDLGREMALAVASRARQHVVVHAGVVGWQGRAIVFPGRTLAGKSSLAAALVRAGADYYSDEYAILGQDGPVRPYLRPLGIRETPAAPQVAVGANEIGGRIGRKALPLSLVLATRYRDGAHWRPRQASRTMGAMTLFANTVNVDRLGERLFPMLHRALQNASVLSGARGDAGAIVQRILSAAENASVPLWSKGE